MQSTVGSFAQWNETRFFFSKLEQCSLYPLGNDHISPTVNGSFESMIFFHQVGYVSFVEGSLFGPMEVVFPTDGSPIESFVACIFQFGINIL